MIEDVLKQKQPIAIFLLGANGSGKSSLRKYLDLSDIQTNIDPDLLNKIALNRGIGDYLVAASKQALKMYESSIKQDLNVCLESTLSGKGALRRIMYARQMGYYVLAYFLGLESVEMNIERVRSRVIKGGHDIAIQIKQQQNWEVFVVEHIPWNMSAVVHKEKRLQIRQGYRQTFA